MNFVNGKNNYPKNLETAHNLLEFRRDSQVRRSGNGLSSEVAFATDGEIRKKKPLSEVVCYNCNKKGHMVYACPEEKVETGMANVTNGATEVSTPTIQTQPHQRQQLEVLFSA